jgi:hypothetical protein
VSHQAATSSSVALTAQGGNRLDLNDQTLRANVRVQSRDTQGLQHLRLTTANGGNGTLDGNYAVRGGDTGSDSGSSATSARPRPRRSR